MFYYIADDDQPRFNFGADASSIITLYVEGNREGATPRRGSGAVSLSGMASGSGSGSSNSGPFAARSPQSANVKVIKAQKNTSSSGKVEFILDEVGYVEVTASTANVMSITEMVRRKWGQSYYLVGNDGLPIGDSSSTRGN